MLKATQLKTIPIQFHGCIQDDVPYWAGECGLRPRQFRLFTTKAIRSRGNTAWIDHPAHRAQGRQPHIYTLDLRSPRPAEVHFSIENGVLTVRGYSWDLGREPLDDFEAGGIHCDDQWHPIAELTNNANPDVAEEF